MEEIEKHCKSFYIRTNRCSSLYNDIFALRGWKTEEINGIEFELNSILLVTGRFPAAAEFIAERDFCFCSRCCHLWSAAFSDSTTYRQHNRACCNRIFVSVYPVELDGIFRRTVCVHKGKMGTIASFYPVAFLSGSVYVYGIREKKEGMMSWEG